MRTYMIIGGLAVLAITLPVAYVQMSRGAPKDPKRTAEAMSELAATPDQVRLWKEIAGTAAALGLAKVPVPERPVQPRQRVVVPNRAVKAQPVALPEGLQAGIRIVSTPPLRGESFSGVVRVIRVEGERLELDLGEQRILTLYARVRGGPMRAQADQRAELLYRVSDDPFDRRQIVALRLETGDGIVSILEGGRKPVRVQIPLFELVASQVGEPQSGTMRVEVRVGPQTRVLTQGQIVEFSESRMTVGLPASVAYVGADAYRVEGNPYAIHLVAWPSQ